MLARKKAILSWRGDLGMSTARAFVGAVGGVMSMLHTVDEVATICALCSDPSILIACTRWFLDKSWHGVYIEVRSGM